MNLKNIHELFEHHVIIMLDAENQLVEALPKMAEAAASSELKEAIEHHLEQTREQAKRLEKIVQNLEIDISSDKDKGMEGIIAAGENMVSMIEKGTVLDAAITGSAQRVEHYEIAAYIEMIALAELMDHEEEKNLLEESLREETETSEKLMEMAESKILPEAEDEQGMEDE